MITHAVAAGPALSLLEAKLTEDTASFEQVCEIFSAIELVPSAATLAVHIAGQAARQIVNSRTDEPASDDADGGITYVIGIALDNNEAPTQDDLDVTEQSAIYLARDRFLTSIAATTIGWDGEYRPPVRINLFRGWDDPAQHARDVIAGIALALERLALIDISYLTDDDSTPEEIHQVRDDRLNSYRRSVALALT